jgi:hypothetical protein
VIICLYLAVLGLCCCSGFFAELWRGGPTLQLQRVGFLLPRLLSLQSTGSRRSGFSSCGSWTLEHRLSSCHSETCGVFLGQGLNYVSCGLLTIELSRKYNSFESLAGSLMLNFSLLIYVCAHEDKMLMLQNAIGI